MSKSILLGKQHDITEFASKDAGRYVINSVHYSPKHKAVEATDGRVLVRVPVVESEDFPPIKGACEAEPIDTIIPTGPLKKALANIPKSSNLPILSYAKLDVNGKVTLTTTDLDTEQAVTCKPVEGNYPNVDQVMPTIEPTLSIGIAANILKRIADYALKHSVDDNQTITFRFIDSLGAIRFEIGIEDGQKLTGVAMPVRMS